MVFGQLAEFDIFGKQERRIKTQFGGIMALACIGTVFLFFYSRVINIYFYISNQSLNNDFSIQIQSIKYILQQQQNRFNHFCKRVILIAQSYFIILANIYVDSRRSYDNDPSELDMSFNKFMVGVNIQQDNFTTNPYYNITLQQRIYVKDSKGNRDKQFIDIPLEKCTYQHWGLQSDDEDEKKIFESIKLDNYLCPKMGTNLSISGQYETTIFKHLKFTVNKCDPKLQQLNNFADTYWKPTCQNDTAVNEFQTKNAVRVQFQLTNMNVNPQQPDDLIKKYISSDLFFQISPKKMYRTSDVYFTEYKIITDESLFPEEQMESTTFAVQEYGDYRDQYTVDAEKTYGAFFFNRSRSYQKFSDLVAQLGGFIQSIIMISAVIVNVYNEEIYSLELANQIYDFDIDDKNKTQNNVEEEVIKMHKGLNKDLLKLDEQLNTPKNSESRRVSALSKKSFLKRSKSIEKLSPFFPIKLNTSPRNKSSNSQSPQITFSKSPQITFSKRETNDQNYDQITLDQNTPPVPTVIKIPYETQQSSEKTLNDPPILYSAKSQQYQKSQFYLFPKSLSPTNKSSHIADNFDTKYLDDNRTQGITIMTEQDNQQNLIKETFHDLNSVFNDQQQTIITGEDIQISNKDKLTQKYLQRYEDLNKKQDFIKFQDSNRSEGNQSERKMVEESKSQNKLYESSSPRINIIQSNCQPSSLLLSPSEQKQQQQQSRQKYLQKLSNFQVSKSFQDDVKIKQCMKLNTYMEKDYNPSTKDEELLTPTMQKTASYCLDKSQFMSQQEKFLNTYKMQMRKHYLKKHINKVIVKHSKLELTCKYLIYRLTCGKCFKTKENQMIQHSKQLLNKDIDIISILNKIKEIEKIKYLLFNHDQMTLFNYFPKPLLCLDKDDNMNLQTQLCKMKKKKVKKLKIKPKYLNVVSKATNKFKNITKKQEECNEDNRNQFSISLNSKNNQMKKIEELFEAYEKLASLQDKQRQNYQLFSDYIEIFNLINQNGWHPIKYAGKQHEIAL